MTENKKTVERYMDGFNGAPRAEPVVPPLHTLLRQGFGGLSADGEIRRSSNAWEHEIFGNILRIHPQA